MASRLLAEGLSLKEIGDHLGHRKLDTTRVYAKVDLAGLRSRRGLRSGRGAMTLNEIVLRYVAFRKSMGDDFTSAEKLAEDLLPACGREYRVGGGHS